jgi:hypothetical protein
MLVQYPIVAVLWFRVRVVVHVCKCQLMPFSGFFFFFSFSSGFCVALTHLQHVKTDAT